MSDPLFYGKPLTFKPGSHRYYWDGQHLPSVTTIIGRLAKPLLIQWAADCAVEHIQHRWQADRGGSPETFAALCAEARKAHTQKRDSAGDVGKIVHQLAVEVQHGKFVDTSAVPAELRGRVEHALGALRQWLGATRMGAADLERRVMSRTHLYAGTTDRWGIIDGHHAVLDFKTGGGVYDEAWYQCAGYELALREELKIAEPIWHYVIHLDKSTGKCTPHVRGPEATAAAKQAWLHLVALDKAIRAMPRLQRAAA
jgi:hypothetical protein